MLLRIFGIVYPGMSSLGDSTLHRAAKLWTFRARAELVAAARFDRLATELAQTNAGSTVIRMAESAASDERRHHQLCTRLATELGAPIDRAPTVHVEPLRCGANDRAQQLLYEVVAMSCVTESVSTAMLMAMAESARDDRVLEVIRSVLKDEVRHAQLGWAYLASLPVGFDTTFIAASLPHMLRDTVSDELFGPEDTTEADLELAGLGGLPRRQRRVLFQSSLREVVLAGLRRFGIDTIAGERWLDSVG
jgi:hypothetical protein